VSYAKLVSMCSAKSCLELCVSCSMKQVYRSHLRVLTLCAMWYCTACYCAIHQVDSDDEDDETMINAALRAIPQQQSIAEQEQPQATAMM
jgi:hypothetical protein